MPRSRSPGRRRSRSRTPRRTDYRKRVDLVTAAERDSNKLRLLEKVRLQQAPRSPEGAPRTTTSSSSKAPPTTRPDDRHRPQHRTPARSTSKSPSRTSAAAPKKVLPQGITRSITREDKWIVMVGGSEYEVQTPFYCGMCSKQLNSCSIEGHCASKAHQAKLYADKDDDWADAASSAAPSQSLPLAAAPAASQFRAAGYLVPQEQMKPPALPPMEMQPFVPQVPGQASGYQHMPADSNQHLRDEQQFQLDQQKSAPALPRPPQFQQPEFPPPPAWTAILDNYFQGPGAQYLADLVAESVEQALQHRTISQAFCGITLPQRTSTPSTPRMTVPTPPPVPVRAARIVQPPAPMGR